MDLKIKIPINDIDNETQSNILEFSSKKSKSQSSSYQKQDQKKKKNHLQQILKFQIFVKKSKYHLH